ncbi:MAG: chemotaxis response regulator protein-glutamate methylesterase [Lentisphaeraceae bacterium]|nr:chemotaxis response regulator protein-glutamate methylesterase [Lentisphaeraceae bacterium]
MIKVLIVDDSLFIRNILSRELAKDPVLNIVATAIDAFDARDKILEFKPDILTLDIEMPRMNGLVFLNKLMKSNPMPVIILSSLTKSSSDLAVESLSCGALEVMAKPQSREMFGEMIVELSEKIKTLAGVHLLAPVTRKKVLSVPTGGSRRRIIALGASTGGTDALSFTLKSMPKNCPGIVIVQHMPEYFTRSFADRLNNICDIEVKEAENGDLVQNGRALIAPGGRHMVLRRQAGTDSVIIKDGPLVSSHRPSVDVLFKSVARYAAKQTIAVLMTGMGSDGAQGLLQIKESGGQTIAQNEATCVVYGMPKIAVDLGAANEVLALEDIPNKLLT